MRIIGISYILLGFLNCAQAQDFVAPPKNASIIYASGEMQDFVETSFGYLKDGKTAARTVLSMQSSDIRDSVSNTPHRVSSANRAMRYADSSLQAAREKELLAALNSPSLSSVKYRFNEQGPKYDLLGMDYRVRKANEGGSLAMPVPAPGERTGGPQAPEFVVVYVDVSRKAPKEAVHSISAATGFKPFGDDVDASASFKGVLAVRGWIDTANLSSLDRCREVRKVVSGMTAASYENGILAPEAEARILIRIPAYSSPRDFLAVVLARLGEGAGFEWQKTISVRATAPSGVNSRRAEYIVAVTGKLPANMSEKAAAYPFVMGVEFEKPACATVPEQTASKKL